MNLALNFSKKLIFILFSACLIFKSLNFASAEYNSTTALIPVVNESKVISDGTIGFSEYGGSFSEEISGIEVFWEHNESLLRVGLLSPGIGWVGIGFRSRGENMGGNIVMGYVNSSGSVILEDTTGIGLAHYSDKDYGGVDNIIYRAGSESRGKTTLEFAFPLITGDIYDQQLVPGYSYEFFLAMHTTADNLVTKHTDRSNPIPVYIDTTTAKPTTLTLSVPSPIFQGEEITLIAKIEDLGFYPAVGVNISFHLLTLFGEMNIGSGSTNSSGYATFNTSFSYFGETQAFARFSGSSEYKSSSAKLTFMVYSGEITQTSSFGGVDGKSESLYGVSPDIFNLFIGLGALAVSLVFGIYVYVLYSVLKNPRQKSLQKGEE